MRIYFVFTLLLAYTVASAQPECYENKQWPMPELGEEAKKTYSTKLSEAQQDYEKDSLSADAIIWLGRREAYLGNYKRAIDAFSNGISLHPKDARFFRHRGHRYITLRCFDKAIKDFKKAAKLVKRKKDEIEPDGLPNAKNTPTSTLQSNIWYHLGLVYYIKGSYKEACAAYKKCMQVSTNPDMYVATANWLYITLRKLNKNIEASKLLATINDTMELIENKDYLDILILYKEQTGFNDPVSFLENYKKGLGIASFGYGLGNYLLLKGETEKASYVFQAVIDGGQWASFGYIAAEEELVKMKERLEKKFHKSH